MVHGVWISLYDVLIFEGSQGLLLDMDCGFYPHVTPSRVGLNGVPKKYLKDAEVYLVTRSYLTRHGNGYEPKYKLEANLEKFKESNTFNEFQLDFNWRQGYSAELLKDTDLITTN